MIEKIQAELHAPKGQKNTFGNYNYRSCEDILAAVKPLLEKHGCYITLSDSIEACEGRVYVRATATIWEGMKPLQSVSAYAREQETKKGMDEAQITGAASSYARKYALNGLLAIDDTKDADTMDNREPTFRFKKGEKQEVYDQVRKALEAGDEHGLAQILGEYKEVEAKIAVWKLFNSSERAAIKALTGDNNE